MSRHRADSSDHCFTTAPVAGTVQPIRIWAIGDSGYGNLGARAVRDAYRAFALTGTAPADVWLMLGDNNQFDGTIADQTDFTASGYVESYQRVLFEMYADLLRKTVLWPALGNHDTGERTARPWPATSPIRMGTRS
jgi:acid phosphatase type 7